jgi:hypothetical protein
MRPPIEDYGLLGDTRTAALVDSDGSVDWLCIPHFDGLPVFGRLVGGAAAGSFRLGPRHPAEVVARGYRTDTATLETTWRTDTGRLTLTEGMVAEVAGQLLPATMLVRRLSAPDGPVDAVITFDPRLGERRRAPRRGPGLQLGDPGPGTALHAHRTPPAGPTHNGHRRPRPAVHLRDVRGPSRTARAPRHGRGLGSPPG